VAIQPQTTGMVWVAGGRFAMGSIERHAVAVA
jgi:hypothetical protein